MDNEKLQELIDASIENFKEGIRKKNPSSYEKLTFIKVYKDNSLVVNDEAVDAAVFLAYNDAKRTMTGISKRKNEREDALSAIKSELIKYFSEEKAPDSEPAFDVFHELLCQKWYQMFEDSEIGTYGKAQKIVNMSFKYLFCCEDARTKYKDHFKYCHMPLDSFTLEWYKREIIPEKVAVWSNLDLSSYRIIQDNIRKYVNKTGNTPLEQEFIEWPKIQMALAAEGFLFGLEGDLTPEKKEKIRKKLLTEKYDQITEKLKEKSELLKKWGI